MFTAYLQDKSAWQAVLSESIWRVSLDWLVNNAADAALGDYPLGAEGWYANVHSYTTRNELDCIWESHAETIDVQYLIAGEEGIRWMPTSQVGKLQRKYDDRDRLEWAPPQNTTTLITLREGMFAIFLPGEAHRPMVAIDTPTSIRKAVVKIPAHLLFGHPPNAQ